MHEQDTSLTPEVIRAFLKSRRTLYTMLTLGISISLAVAFILPKKYTATATILPSGDGNALGRLGSMVLGQASALTSELPPNSSLLYPTIISSRYILRKLAGSNLTSRDGEISLMEYLGAKNLDDAEKILRSTIGVELDRKTMLIRIKVTTKDPKLSASIANRLIALLRDFNNTKSSKLAKSELQYLREKLKETKEELYLAENKLMEYEKRHIDYATTTDPVVIMEHDKLKRELELKENSFIDILKEIELKEIEIKRTSPVVNVLDYATTPTVKSAPRRKLIAIVGALLTTFVSMSYCILKEIPIQSLLQRFT